MKIQLWLCTMLLFSAACSGVTDTITPTSASPGQASAIASDSHTISTSTPILSRSTPLATEQSVSPATPGCIPSLTPVDFFPGGEQLLGFRDAFVLVYDFTSHSITLQFQVPRRVVKAALSPNGQLIAVGLEDFSILLVNASDQQVIHTITVHQGNISGLAFSPAGDRLLSASEDTWVRIWSLDGQELDAFQPGGANNVPSAVMGIGISPDWKILATIPFDGLMSLWSLHDHSLLGSFEGSIRGGYSGSQAAFSPDGQYLAQHLGAGGGYLSLWRIADGELVLRGENITGGVDFSDDGRYLAYAEMLPSGGGRVVLRSADGSQHFYDLKGSEGSLPAFPLFTPDGNQLVAFDFVSNTLLAWRTSDGQLMYLGDTACPAN